MTSWQTTCTNKNFYLLSSSYLPDGYTWTEKDCKEWDWDKDTQIPGYSSAELMKSCLAVVNGPTWIKRTDVEAALSKDRGKGVKRKMKRRLTLA